MCCFDSTQELASQMLPPLLTLSCLPARAMYLCVCAPVDGQVWVCMGRPEVSVRCHPPLLSTMFLTELGAMDLARLVGQGFLCL